MRYARYSYIAPFTYHFGFYVYIFGFVDSIFALFILIFEYADTTFHEVKIIKNICARLSVKVDFTRDEKSDRINDKVTFFGRRTKIIGWLYRAGILCR